MKKDLINVDLLEEIKENFMKIISAYELLIMINSQERVIDSASSLPKIFNELKLNMKEKKKGVDL